MRRLFSISLVLASVLLAGVAFGQASVDVSASADTTIYADVPDNSGGAGASLWVGNTGGTARRVLISFALSTGNIPAGSSIASATMFLYMTKIPGTGPGFSTLSVRRISVSWGEGVETGSGGGGVLGVFPSATWNRRFATSTGWSSPGGDVAGSDSGSWTEDATIGGYKAFTGGAMASDVQGWLASPGTNNGWLIFDTGGTPYTARQFDSRDGANAPILRIGYFKPLGAACGGGGECGSGNCPNGFCCNVGICPPQTDCQSSAPTCGSGGSCSSSNYAAGTGCASDGNACTTDVCNGSGSCTHPAGNAGAACQDDGNACTADQCDGSSPVCQHIPDPNGSGCIISCTVDTDCPAGKWCSTGICQAKLGNGIACSVGRSCVSGQCVDGVCCNAACGGQCEACDISGQLGVCTATTGPPHGARGACVSDLSVCGGRCNGTLRTACTFPTAPTSCRSATCSNGVGTLGATCNGTGKCPAVQTLTCPPYVCGIAACLTTCNADVDCVSGDYCDAHLCKPKVTSGGVCTSDSQCVTEHCVDGVCCDQRCSGQCQACDVPGKEGKCSPVSGAPHGRRTPCADTKSGCGGACDGKLVTACAYPGPGVQCRAASCSADSATLAADCDGSGSCPPEQHQACKPFHCDAKNSICSGDCAVDTDCGLQQFCAAGVCAPALPNGTTCAGANQCESSYCVDGVCCSSPCTGQCQACNVPGDEGTCDTIAGAPHGIRPPCATDGTACAGACDGIATSCTYPAGTVQCRAPGCATGTATLQAFCQGTGECPAIELEPCRPNTCVGTRCGGGCATDANCTSAQFCAGGVCVPKFPQSQPCAGNSQCANGQCVDGFCCDKPCTGECEACDVIPFVGKCTVVPSGTAPHGGRVPCQGAGRCAATCDGTSRVDCKYAGGMTECGLGVCKDGVQRDPSVCNGAGSCRPATGTSCGAFACSTAPGPAACLGACANSRDCAPGYGCVGNDCVLGTNLSRDAGSDAAGNGGSSSVGDAGGAGGASGSQGTSGSGALGTTDGGIVGDSGHLDAGRGKKGGSNAEGACGCRLEGRDRTPHRGVLSAFGLTLMLLGRRRARRRPTSPFGSKRRRSAELK